MQISLQSAARIINAQFLRPNDASFNGISYDNRTTSPGNLFVAIKGNSNDGHLFAEDAIRQGAVAVLAERDPLNKNSDSPVLLVHNSLNALLTLGHYYRSAFKGKVLAITGTAGKTTTKELLRNILKIHGKTAFTPKNKNTQLGISASLLDFDGDEKYWIMEAGINHPNDMLELGSLLEPDIAVILNVGVGHTLGLGDKGTAYYKTRLLNYIRTNGLALVSEDYPDLIEEAEKFGNVIFFSVNKHSTALFKAQYLGINSKGKGQYRLHLDGSTIELRTGLTGSYAAENIIAAASAGKLLGLSIEEIQKGIESYEQPEQRFKKIINNGWTIIDDSYNSNPLSAARMLEAAEELQGEPFVCVMGEMLELGKKSEEEHIRLGEKLAEVHCTDVYWTGNMAESVQAGLKNKNFSGSFILINSESDFSESLLQHSDYFNTEHGVILFKGSRSNKMERFVNLFENRK